MAFAVSRNLREKQDLLQITSIFQHHFVSRGCHHFDVLGPTMRQLLKCSQGQLLSNETDNKAAATGTHIAWGDHLGHDVHLFFWVVIFFNQKGSKV